jgi:ubiquitin carboxyl-terminal hydrolase 14
MYLGFTKKEINGNFVILKYRFKYDDALVTPVKIEDILNLRGGGDWHMAYYCIYRKLETK